MAGASQPALFYVIGCHAQVSMCSYPVGEELMERTHLQIGVRVQRMCPIRLKTL